MTELRNSDLMFEAFHEQDRLWVALSLADAPVVRAIPVAVDKQAGDITVRRTGATTEMTLPPHGWGVLAKRLESEPPELFAYANQPFTRRIVIE